MISQVAFLSLCVCAFKRLFFNYHKYSSYVYSEKQANLTKSPSFFWHCLVNWKQVWEFSSNFCGFLRIYELCIQWNLDLRKILGVKKIFLKSRFFLISNTRKPLKKHNSAKWTSETKQISRRTFSNASNYICGYLISFN